MEISPSEVKQKLDNGEPVILIDVSPRNSSRHFV
jgi:hypothetical protein